jgi:recombination protein RecA
MSKLDEVIKEMNKKANDEVVAVGLPKYSYKRIPFTSPRMNYCTFGGIPVGKLTEFFGEEHGGKTTSALDIIANYQQMDVARKVLYIDAENTLDVSWARKLGVDVDNMLVFKPTSQSAEAIFQFILDAVATGEIGLWVLDSIGVLSSQQELDKTMEEKTYAGISSALTVFGRKIEMLMQRYQCTGIGINQLRDDLGAMWGGATKTPGGRAWKHYCCVRLQFSKGKYIDEAGNDLNRSVENPAGNYVLMSMVKNKSCPPTRRTGFYTLNYEYGIDYLKDLVEVAVKYGFIEKSGAWFSVLNPETGELIVKLQGMPKVYEYLGDEANESVLSVIEACVDKKIYSY